jgi:intraflagellar transport protein 140
VEYHFKANNAHDAFALVQQMRQRRIVLHPYLEQDLLEQIHRAVGADLPFDEQAKDIVDDDVVNEEVDEVDSDEDHSHTPVTHK